MFLGSFWSVVFGVGSGCALGSILGPSWRPKRLQNSSPKALGRGSDAESRKSKKLQTLHGFCLFFTFNLTWNMALQKVENRVKNQVEDKTETGIENSPNMGQLRPPNRTKIGAKSLPRGMPKHIEFWIHLGSVLEAVLDAILGQQPLKGTTGQRRGSPAEGGGGEVNLPP